MRRLALAVLALAAVALALWLALRSGRLTAVATAAPVAEPPAAPVPPLAEAPAVEDVRVPREAQSAPAEPLPTPAAPPVREREPDFFLGRVVDGTSGLPVPGARALISGARGVFRPAEVAADELVSEATSDGRGFFRLGLPAGHGLGQAQLSAEGYGLRSFVFDRAHATEDEAELFELWPAASLVLRIRDPAGQALEGIAVELSSAGTEVFRAGGSFFASESAHWTATTDDSGSARFTALPAETVLAWSFEPWRAVRPFRDERPHETISDRVALAPGEQRELDVTVGGGATIAGRVTDEQGQAVAGLELWLVRPTEEPRLQTGRPCVARATSDERGRFALADVPYERFVLGPSPEQETFVPIGRALEVDRARLELDLTVERGLAIEGRVVETAGAGELDFVIAQSLDGLDFVEAELGEQGAFRLEPLAPGEHQVYGWGIAAGTEVLRVAAGASGVELHALANSEVWIRIDGAPEEFQFEAFDLQRETWESGGQRGSPFRWRFAPGAYALLATDPGERVAFLPRLTIVAGAPAPEVQLTMQPAASVTFVHRAETGVRALRVWLDGARFPLMPLRAGARGGLVAGAAETVLVPPGALRAELLEQGRTVATESVSVGPGERRRIELVPR